MRVDYSNKTGKCCKSVVKCSTCDSCSTLSYIALIIFILQQLLKRAKQQRSAEECWSVESNSKHFLKTMNDEVKHNFSSENNFNYDAI